MAQTTGNRLQDVPRHPCMPVWLLALLAFFLSFGLCAATPVPQLVVTYTNEACAGAGSITCVLQDPAGTNIKFRIYTLPDTVNPTYELTPVNNTVSVTAGSYQVVATETVNGSPVSYPAQQVTITNAQNPLSFGVTHTDAHCGDGTITIAIVNGSPSFLYEIMEGPETFPPGPANTFTNLTGGIYKVRVTDGCGAQLTQTHVVPQHPVDLIIGGPSFPDEELPACDQITVKNTIDPVVSGYEPLYPLQLIYTIHPPDGSPDITVTETITSGGPQAVIPFWYDTVYYYDLQITDFCGNVYTRNNNLVKVAMTVLMDTFPADCVGYFFSIKPVKFVGPYTITILEAPAAFNPNDFNANHPGPFSTPAADYGNSTQPVPFGNYSVQVTDACGHTMIKTQEIADIPIPANVMILPHPGCESNMSDVVITWPGQEIVSAIMIAAPGTYAPSLPLDVTSFLTGIDEISIPNLTVGDYEIVVTNICGLIANPEVPNVRFSILDLPGNLGMVTSTRADCELGLGGIRIRGDQSNIVSISMTAAPAAFNQTLPVDVTGYLTTGGTFSMAALPPGLYSFLLTDTCGVTHTVTDKEVLPYLVTQNDISIVKHCNSFEVHLYHTSVNTVSEMFWLQQWDPVQNAWVHPVTGVAFVVGGPVNGTNALALVNNSDNINQDFLGEFRVIKTFVAFENGYVSDNPFKTCLIELEHFTHDGHVRITDILKLTCDGSLSTIKVVADGVAPFNYTITHKNGEPFFIDNGSDDTFENLEAAVYTFSVQQYCGDSDTRIEDISSLPSLVEAFPPEPELFSCEEPSGNDTGTFDLTVQDALILGTQDPALYAITYHANQSDADSGNNPISSPYTSTNATVFGRIAVIGGDCYRTVSFALVVHPLPEAGLGERIGICPDDDVTLQATAGFDAYVWSTGETTSAITVSEPGTYAVTVTRNHPSGPCSATFAIVVEEQVVPEIDHIDLVDWTDHDNSITVVLSNPQNVGMEFSIDGQHYQASNVFTGLYAGTYTVHVRDTAGCGEDVRTVHLLNYPKFFTPNGDGYNDYWKVKFSETEPGLKTFIFDRYGKFLKQLGYDSIGWDGTYTGKPVPSTDYWFLVIRADGRELRGHFTMKR